MRGHGLIAAVELVADKAAHRNFDPALRMGPRLSRHFEAQGVISRALAGDVLAFSPPLIITRAEIDEMLARAAAAFAAFSAELKSESLRPA